MLVALVVDLLDQERYPSAGGDSPHFTAAPFIGSKSPPQKPLVRTCQLVRGVDKRRPQCGLYSATMSEEDETRKLA